MKCNSASCCIDCKHRKVGCHSTCELYQEYVTEHQKWKDKVIENKKKYGDTYIPDEARVCRK